MTRSLYRSQGLMNYRLPDNIGYIIQIIGTA